MDIKVGDYNVLESGSIICMDSYPVIFTFGKLAYKIVLHKNESVNKTGRNIDFQLNSKDENLAEMHLYLGGTAALASDAPYMVGKYNGHSLSFAFHINNFTAMTETNMPVVLNYTWLQREIETTPKSSSVGEVNVEKK